MAIVAYRSCAGPPTRYSVTGVGHDGILVVANTVESSDEGAAIVGGDVHQLVEERFELGVPYDGGVRESRRVCPNS